VEFLEPWYSIADEPDQVAGMNKELRREVGDGHPLYGLPVRATGCRLDCDDVLFAIDDGTGRFAVVHLTWNQAPEPLPWPGTSLYASFDMWLVEGMRRDFDDFHRNDDAN